MHMYRCEAGICLGNYVRLCPHRGARRKTDECAARNVCVNQLNYLNLNIAAARRSVQMINIDCGGHFQFYSATAARLSLATADFGGAQHKPPVTGATPLSASGAASFSAALMFELCNYMSIININYAN